MGFDRLRFVFNSPSVRPGTRNRRIGFPIGASVLRFLGVGYSVETPDERHQRMVAEDAEQAARIDEETELLLAEIAAWEQDQAAPSRPLLRHRPKSGARPTVVSRMMRAQRDGSGCAVCGSPKYRYPDGRVIGLCANCRVGSLEWQQEQKSRTEG